MPVYPCLMPHPSEPSVLLLQAAEGWTLPVIEHEGGWVAYVGCLVARKVSEQLGIRVTALRHIRHEETDACEVENHSPQGSPPPNGRGADSHAAAELAFWSPA